MKEEGEIQETRKVILTFSRMLECSIVLFVRIGKLAWKKKWWVLGLIVWAGVAWLVVKPLPKCGCLRVAMLDIGQGDSFVLQTPDEKKYFVDFGRGSNVVPAYQKLFGSFDRQITEAIFTHPDLDHLGGSLALLRQYVFQNILGSWPEHILPEVRALQNYWVVKPEQAVGPKKIQLAPDVFMEILWPQQDIRNLPTKNTNDQSMVFKLIYKHSSILMTGDAEEKTEKELLKQKVNLKADILKVSHHGSKTGTSLEFLKAVAPAIGLISAGAGNRYGHPHAEVVKRLESFGVKIYRTDRDGDIVLESDGNAWRVLDKTFWQKWQAWLIR